MKQTRILQVIAGTALAVAAGMASAQDKPVAAGHGVPATLDNFVRAESDMYLANLAKQGGLGKLHHRREPASIDNQTVIRLNRDTIYSSGVFDLDAGPVTITMPNPGKRFFSMQVINEDHYTQAVYYGAGKRVLTRDNVGTRYVVVGIRTLVDPDDPEDLKRVHALQDAIQVSQASVGKLELPDWDAASQKKIRDALLVLASAMPDFRGAFGRKQDVDPLRHMIGTAAGWGGNPDKDAQYLNVTPRQNDGKTVYRLRVKQVPVDGFWSVSVYNAKGYFEKNPANAYTINNLTAKRDTDGSIRIQFGGCDTGTANCLPITEGWNYTVRMYQPKKDVLSGKYKFPEPEAVR
ncbi:DUF1254 domain-containing protein [Cupriavidus agavae]|uniref:DUF1254 domain-containing protein n=1 Tax=Cupriavidus agavae TaxID=1001822 RepID=UPI0038B2BCEE